MSLTVVKGVHSSGNPPGTITLSGSIGTGQLICVWVDGGGIPGSETVSDNVNTGSYTRADSYSAGHMALYYIVTNATGTPVISIASTGGFADCWACGVTGFAGTPTLDSGLTATATGTGTALAINATSNFPNEIMLANLNYSTTYTNPVTGNSWSLATSATDSTFNAFYAIENAPTANNFAGTIAASQTWFLQITGFYDPNLGILAANGTFSLTGENVSLGISGFPVAVGTFSLTGEGANLAATGASLTLLAAPGVFNYLGASSLTNYGLDPSVGLFGLAGQAVVFGGSGVGLNLAPQQGAFTVTGVPAALVFAGISGGSVTASAGGFVVTGLAAALGVSNLPPSSSGVLGRPGGRTIFSTKKVSEQVDFIWDFVSSLGPGETILQAVLSASTYMGNDTTPASIVGGPAVVSGTQVYQLILGGLVGQIYGVTCTITTSLGQTLAMSAYLAIEPNLP